MKTITKPQIAKIHVLLNNKGWLDQKKEIILDASDGRTASSKELTIEEARHLIIMLAEHDPAERLKSLVFSLAYQAGIIYGSSADDKKINAAKLNLFIMERGAVKKELNKMNYTDLVKVHRQFEAIVRSTQKSKNNKEANNVVANLLNELSINSG